MSDKYSDGVLDEKFDNLKELIDAYMNGIGKQLSSLDTKVSTTNGSVAAVVKKQERQEGFSEAIKIFGGTTITVLIGCIGYFFISLVSLQGAVKTNTANIKSLQENLPEMLTAAAKAGIIQAAGGK